ncbi:MAG: cytochrome c-type biogenesis protein [Dehalococcoidia bacterium]
MNAPLCAIRAACRTKPVKAAFSLALIIVMFTLAACSGQDPTLEQRAFALDRELMCPVCDGQTLDQSHAQIAQDMKAIIREKLADGESEAQIKDYFVARYGESVLASPNASGFNILVWAVPPVFAVAGAMMLWMIIRSMRTARPEYAAPPADPGLGEYLARVDEDTGLTRARELDEPGRSPGGERA